MKRVYDFMPHWIQSMLVSAWAIGTNARKYGPVFWGAMDELERNESRTSEEMNDLRSNKLSQVLREAKRDVPFYRDSHCSPESIESWPIVDRATIAAQPRSFINERLHKGQLGCAHTSGTSGTPLSVLFSWTAYQREMAFRWRHRSWGGIAFGSRGAYLAGHPVVPPDQRKPPFWRRDIIENRLLMSSYHMSRETLPHYLRALREFQPSFIHGYPSSLYLLAIESSESGIALRPQAVFAGSETLLSYQRRAIEAAFGTRVFNWYGQTELTCNIVECRHGSLHLRSDYGFLEVEDDGIMICTGFNNDAMPLIRYRCGDRAQLSNSGCECGLGFPVVHDLEGRTEDYVITREGYLVGRLDHLFKDAEGVGEAQIVQSALGEVLIRIVPTANYTGQSEATIRREAGQRLGPRTKITIECVEKIERGPNGKFRFIVNDVAAEARFPEYPVIGVR